MKLPFIDLKSQYNAHKEEINQKILSVLESTQFILGPEVSKLEKDLASFTKSKHTIVCSSGTDALLISLMSLGIKTGDEVITTPFTFIATAEVIALVGATPVFVDIDEETYNIDSNLIENAITDKTKAILPVSLYGQCSNMDKINEIAKKHGLFVVEDGCQSLGATYNGKESCNLSDIGCTSFFPSKPLGCYGDGGAIFTSDDALAKKIRTISNHGQEERYKHKYIGINGRLDAIQAAILNVKMKYFKDEIKKRGEIGARYNQLLKDCDVITPKILEGRTSVFAQYSIRHKKRDDLASELNQAGIPTAVHYPISLHQQEAFAYLGYKDGDFPVSEKISKEIMSLPMSPYLTAEQQDLVVNSIKEFA